MQRSTTIETVRISHRVLVVDRQQQFALELSHPKLSLTKAYADWSSK